MDKNKTYTLTELESIFKLTHVTLLNWVKTGKLKAVKVGRKWLVNEETVRAMLGKEAKK